MPKYKLYFSYVLQNFHKKSIHIKCDYLKKRKNRLVLLVEQIGIPGENYRPATSHKLYHIKLYRIHLTMNWI